MKKILLLLTLIMVFSLTQAQITFKSGDDYKFYNGVSGDTLDGSYLLKKSIYLGLKDFKYDYQIECKVDSAGDGTDITVRLRGSMDGINYTNIGDAINWSVTTTDTTIKFDNLTRTKTVAATISSFEQSHKGTSSVAAYIITTDTTGLASYFADTTNVAEQITTYTDTITIPSYAISTTETYEDGVAWRYLQLYFLGGGANADMNISPSGNPIRIRILKNN